MERGVDFNWEDFALRHGAWGRDVLSKLGRNRQFINALDSPTGKEFIKRLRSEVERRRIEYDMMDVDSSNNHFIEARAKYVEAQNIFMSFLGVVETQEKMIKDIIAKTGGNSKK